MTNINPWATPGEDHHHVVSNGASAPPAGVTPVGKGSVWDAYQQSITELAHAQAAALQETDSTTQEAQATVERAWSDVEQARADRTRVEDWAKSFEAKVAQILADAGVSPDGAGSGSAELPVTTPQEALTAMDGLTDQLHLAHRELDQARSNRTASTARWIAVGVIIAAALITVGALALLGAAGYVQAAGGLIAFCVAWPARARGWVTGAIRGGIAAGVLIAVVALTGPVLSAIFLLLGAVVTVVLTARSGMVRATRVTPGRAGRPQSGPTGSGPPQRGPRS